MRKKIEMEIVHPYAAGIDIGSKSDYVAVGQELSDVKEFGISHTEHLRLAEFSKNEQRKTSNDFTTS